MYILSKIYCFLLLLKVKIKVYLYCVKLARYVYGVQKLSFLSPVNPCSLWREYIRRGSCLNRCIKKGKKMAENDTSKIRTNGRPIMDDVERKSDYIKFRVNEEQKKKFKQLHLRLAPNLSEAEFARIKVLDDNIILFGIRDIPEKEREILREIALLGNQFNMVASRKNITLTQERQFKEDSQKVREILTSTYKKVLEYQQKELHYFKIGTIVENIREVLFSYEENKNEALLIKEVTSIYEKLNDIYQLISTDKK